MELFCLEGPYLLGKLIENINTIFLGLNLMAMNQKMDWYM